MPFRQLKSFLKILIGVQYKIEAQHTGRSQRVRGTACRRLLSTEAFAKSGRPPIITARRCENKYRQTRADSLQ